MQALQDRLKESRRLRAELGNEEKEPLAKEDRVLSLARKQYRQGLRIFASQLTTIHKCAETNDLAGLRQFLSGLHPEPIDIQDRWGNTCLVLASERGYAHFVKALLKEGADPKIRNAKGQTAVHAAVVGGHVKVLKTLHSAGASVLDRDNTGALPAHYAAQADDATILAALYDCCRQDEDGRKLILEGTMNGGMTPAHSAALFDSPDALAYLNSLGCDLDAQDEARETPAHKAARVQALGAVAYLRAQTAADFCVRNAEGDTPDDLLRDNTRAWLCE
ncbi:hypothetical protein CTAYLR_001523 [Chrysophaeum taylorii]|uniref:Uncharacterized protein n=1 Tax=Chrysophaeum taylorii TaxID=2483200 RepID=A0AAD7XLR1_9STRA|nr:hypothetical protein CTAYLR_001523 [Chrysophaeum taylorii]